MRVEYSTRAIADLRHVITILRLLRRCHPAWDTQLQQGRRGSLENRSRNVNFKWPFSGGLFDVWIRYYVALLARSD